MYGEWLAIHQVLAGKLCYTFIYIQENKNIKNVKRCRDGMPKSMQTR